MNLKLISPNLLTTLNLIFGCVACVFTVYQAINEVYLFILLAAIMDFIDGFIARKIKATSKFGSQLDSLADLVSFGVAPALLFHSMIMWNLEINSENPIVSFELLGLSINFDWLPFTIISFLITIGVAYRLANFNKDSRQQKSFIGLPSPALALLIVPLPLLAGHQHFEFLSVLLESKIGVSLLVISALILLFLPIRMLKLTLSIKADLIEKLILIISAIILLFVYQLLAVPLIVVIYLLINVARSSIKR